MVRDFHNYVFAVNLAVNSGLPCVEVGLVQAV